MDPVSIEVGGLDDRELAWCTQNHTVPEASSVLLLAADGQVPQAALAALRKVMPALGPFRVKELYAYVVPSRGRTGEGIPAYLEGGLVKMLVGFDLMRMRSFGEVVADLTASGTPPALWRFDFDRFVSDAELAILKSLNAATMECHEIFAFTGTVSGTGDETFMAVPTPHGIGMMVHGHVAAARDWLPQVAAMRAASPQSDIRLRRFTRAGRAELPNL